METISLQTLDAHETEQVSGGILPAIIGGIIGSYVYDQMGGYDGINRAATNALNHLGGHLVHSSWRFRRT